MSWDWSDINEENASEDSHILQGYLDVQALLDRFVKINYETASDAAWLHTGGKGIAASYVRQQIVDIIRNNPPLASMPSYFEESAENYLWYSDFYDDVPKDIMRRYGQFVAPTAEIAPANYTTELAKIDLPYFKELVNLVSLLKSINDSEEGCIEEPLSTPQAEEEIPAPQPVEEISEAQHDEAVPEYSPQKRRLSSPTRSYEPNMNMEQLSLLAECMNAMEVFSEQITGNLLSDLLTGRQPRLFHITNQRKFTYLFDTLRDAGYITKTWIATAGHNCEFASVPQNPANDTTHFITSQQFTNCRRANKSQYIHGENTVEELMEKLPAL